MRWQSDWWGIVLIPETEEEAVALDELPKKAETSYEEGMAEWEDNVDYLASILRCEESQIVLPLGKALVLNR